MAAVPFPIDEDLRLIALRSLGILDTAPEEMFGDIVDMAADISGCPTALVSLVDQDRQWFKAKIGLDACETPRDLAFCAHALLRPQMMWVEDARSDPRFADNPLVTGEPFIRFYGGAPITVDGQRIGTVCIIDCNPRPYDDKLARRIERLAAMAADRMVARRELKLIGGAIEFSPDAIITADIDGMIQRWNPAATQLFGFSQAEAIGRSFDLITPEPLRSARQAEFRNIVSGQAANQQGHVNEMPGLCRDGTVVPLEVSFAVHRIAGQVSVTALMRNCAERISREESLIAALAQAQAGAKAKDEFLRNISHEVRTPLNGIIGLSSALTLTPLPADEQRMLRTITASATSLNELLKDAIELAGIEDGSVELETVPFAVKDKCLRVAGLFAGECAEKGIGIEVKVDDACGVRLGDPIRIRQILCCLLSNAIKFTEKGKVGLAASLAPNGAVTIAIHDTGIGFAPDQSEQIFERFKQIDGSLSREFGGAGLGLATARALAMRMGGNVTAIGQPGVGATFTLSLPLGWASAQAEGSSTLSDDEQGDYASVESGQIRVLMAEDNPTNRKVVELILASVDVSLTSVENGFEAVQTYKSEPFDVILMDLQMPVMDGITAIREIRRLEEVQRQRRTPIIVVSANAMNADKSASHKAGADDHIGKPLSPDVLLAALSAAINEETSVGESGVA